MAMRRVGALIVVCALAACGDGGQGLPAARTLSYNGSTPFPAVVGEAIALTPAVSERADLYTVTPSLPSGLSLNGLTELISGTPTRASEAATFAITATYRGGHSTFCLVVSVTEPPSHLSYPSPAKGTVGAVSYALEPKSRRNRRELVWDAGPAGGSGARQHERPHHGYAQRRQNAGPLYDHGEQSGR